MASSTNIVLVTLSIFLGAFFLFFGILKVTPDVSRDMHRELRRTFVSLAKVFPVLSFLGVKVSPKYYRLTVGYTEIVCGFVLIFVPGRIKLVANGALLILSVNGIYSHYTAKDKFERIAPCIIFTLMLACRLVVHYQVRRREKNKTPDQKNENAGQYKMDSGSSDRAGEAHKGLADLASKYEESMFEVKKTK